MKLIKKLLAIAMVFSLLPLEGCTLKTIDIADYITLGIDNNCSDGSLIKLSFDKESFWEDICIASNEKAIEETFEYVNDIEIKPDTIFFDDIFCYEYQEKYNVSNGDIMQFELYGVNNKDVNEIARKLNIELICKYEKLVDWVDESNKIIIPKELLEYIAFDGKNGNGYPYFKEKEYREEGPLKNGEYTFVCTNNSDLDNIIRLAIYREEFYLGETIIYFEKDYGLSNGDYLGLGISEYLIETFSNKLSVCLKQSEVLVYGLGKAVLDEKQITSENIQWLVDLEKTNDMYSDFTFYLAKKKREINDENDSFALISIQKDKYFDTYSFSKYTDLYAREDGSIGYFMIEFYTSIIENEDGSFECDYCTESEDRQEIVNQLEKVYELTPLSE